MRRRLPLPVLRLAFMVTVSRGASIGCATSPDMTNAVDLGSEIFERLAADRPDLDRPGECGATPLQHAAARGDIRIVQFLLRHGARTDTRDPEGMTPLLLAVRAGSLACMQALLEAGADVNVASERGGQRPLHFAVSGGTPESVELLLSHGADPNARDSAWNQTPLHLLAATDWYRSTVLAARMIAAGADLSARDLRGFTPLHVAASTNDPAVVREYVRRGRDLDDLTDSGRSPLDLALEYQNDLAAQILAEAGATTHALPRRLPPLHEAARMDDVDRVLAMLADGADPKARYQHRTPLEIADEYASTRASAVLSRFDSRAR